MPEEQLKAFLEKVKVDTSLQEKLKAADSPELLLRLLKQQGFQLPQKIFNYSNRQWPNYQTRIWKMQLAGL